ncbi:MAG: sodium:proton antiporter [Lachnospiraceae bacterium]|nr:sodium:proton antiporter [Lachnospiraceae bacterium]
MLGGVMAYIIGKKNKKARDYFASAVTIIEMGLLIYCSGLYLTGKNMFFTQKDLCGLGISLKLDGFRIILGVVAAFMWTMTTIFSKEYMAHYPRTNRYYLFFLITLGATVGVFLSADLFTTFLFFEIMSFTSYTWVAHDETKESLRAAETYLCVAVIGGMVMLMGLFLLYNMTGTLRMDELHEAVNYAIVLSPDNKLKTYVAGGCILFGFGAKAGMFPLHIWLPKAHPVAPAPASALLSGILTKSGIFGIIVISAEMFLYDYNWGMLILILGVITMFLGALLGIFSINIKRTLACSSMSQIGFILVGIGMQGLLGEENSLAIRGTVLHMINHSMIKLVLFICAGIIYMNIHELDLNKIRGFGKGKKLLMIAFLVGGLSISGIPMFSGYVSKTLLHESIVEFINIATPDMYGKFKFVEVIFLVTGGMTLAYMTKLFVAVFVEEGEKVPEERSKTSRYMNGQSSLALLLSVLVLFGLGTGPYRIMDNLAKMALPFMKGKSMGIYVDYYSFTNLKGSIISIVLGVNIYYFIIRKFLMRTDEDGKRIYVNMWPEWLDIENLIYRPVLQHIIPFVMALILRVFDRFADHVIYVLKSTLFKEVEPRRPLLYGNIFTHVVGGFIDRMVDLINNIFRKDTPVKENYEKKLALSIGHIIKTSRLTARSVSFGLLMFSIGCIFTLVYLVMVLLLHIT